MNDTDHSAEHRSRTDARRLFWSAIWLAIVFVSIKAYYLGVPDALALREGSYLRSIAAISYTDGLFAAAFWVFGRLTLISLSRFPRVRRVAVHAFVVVAAVFCIYAVVNVVVFGVFGGFLTYPLLALVGNVRMLRSSVALHLTAPVVIALVSLPVTYMVLVHTSVACLPAAERTSRRRSAVASAIAFVGIWTAFGQHTYSADWTTRARRQISENSHWVLVLRGGRPSAARR